MVPLRIGTGQNPSLSAQSQQIDFGWTSVVAASAATLSQDGQ